MYATSSPIQIQSFKPRAKSDVKFKERETRPQFRESLSLAAEKSSVQKNTSSESKEESKPIKQTFDKPEEHSLMEEANLVNEQVAMAMLSVNKTQPYFEIMQNDPISTLIQNDGESALLSVGQGTVLSDSSIITNKTSIESFNSAETVSDSFRKGNELFTKNVHEGIKNPLEIKNVLEPIAMKESIKTGMTLSQLNETLKNSLVNDRSGISTSSETQQIKQNDEILLQTQKYALKEDNPMNLLNGTGTLKQEPLDFSKINIKVGESAMDADPNVFGKDIAEKILYHASKNRNVFELQLNPKELGSIQIKLTFESGKASVILNCSNPKTQELLMGQSDNIRHIIEQQTGSHTVVTVKEDAYANQQDFDGRGQNSRQEEQKQQSQKDNTVNAEQFLQQLKLGLLEKEDINYGFG